MKPKFFLFFLLLVSVLTTNYSLATVRYVSKTGTSTPPYTSWETAADSIQKAVNIADVGDTIYVANGVYYESIYVDKTIHLIGSSMDSTIVDGTNTLGVDIIYCYKNNSNIKNFKIISSTDKRGIFSKLSNLNASFLRLINIRRPLEISSSSVTISNCIINVRIYGLTDRCIEDTCHSVYYNNIFWGVNSQETPIYFDFGGKPTFNNNIVIEGNPNYLTNGIELSVVSGAFIKNNLVSSYFWGNTRAGQINSDTVYFENNVSVNSPVAFKTSTGNRTIIKNNIAKDCYKGIESGGLSNPDYNLFWNLTQLSSGSAILGDSNIVADPMFVNDTIPIINGTYDYHLQAFSPAIDKGNPDILDVDGSRSDIGLFGGPNGQKYTYQDLAPKPPRNLTAAMDSGLVHLKWNKNTEADFFRYRVYRDTVPNFIYDTTKIIAVVADTFYNDNIPQKYLEKNYYYKITAIDNSYNQSAASEEVHVNITGIPEAPPIIVEHYNLLQNYPNPFSAKGGFTSGGNSGTTIPYRLKAPGYVKVMVYNLLGELVRVLVNQYQNAGYYEVEFDPTLQERKSAEGKVEFETGYGHIVSGIYLYRIEVIGEGNIPVFTDMKKMMLVK